MVWIPSHEASPSRLADKLAAAHGELATHGNSVGASLNLPAFEARIVDIHHLLHRSDFPGIVRIVDDQVRVAADLDRTFLRKETEDLGWLSAGSIDKAMQVAALLLDALGIE